ncbi:MAG: dihydroxy-acid dehydratase [Actinomycetota bacterium]|jgi:dihydroxy-acid dehydratase|nr:dihydroxy-acid dehydratase [Rubrobacter sp.]MDQ3507663.1 dihydroxy-acid dehydratase [Actinomycetota bacterium]
MTDAPRIGVLSHDSDFAEKVGEAGGEAVPLSMPEFYGEWGVALVREWVSDRLEVSLPFLGLDALAFDADSPEELAGVAIAAIRTGLPAVCLARPETPFSVAVAALGISPLGEDPAEVVVRAAKDARPEAGSLVENFSLANALRAGLTVGGGPEVMVHLAAMAKEADGVVGFDQMLRVLAPETPAFVSVFSEWFEANGIPGVLSLLGDDIHDTRTVSGSLKSHARAASSEPSDERFEVSFVKARTSGAEAVCLASEGLTEVEGVCRVFDSEADAVEAVFGGGVEDVGIFVVRGCGPRGYPGLCRLDEFAHAIEEAGVEGASILTDGLAPEEAPGVWISLFSPESASRGIISRLEDGDFLKFDLTDGRILTSVGARDFARRKRVKPDPPQTSAYAARYAKAATTALDGASFR